MRISWELRYDSAGTVAYVKLAGSRNVELRCRGLETLGCIQGEPSGSTDLRYRTSSPIAPEMYFLLAYFVAIPVPGEDGTPLDVVDRLESTSAVREAEWQGMPATVNERSDSGVDSFGTYQDVTEIWLDPAERRYERRVNIFDQDLLGSVTTMTETIERGFEAGTEVSFSVEDLTLSLDDR